jgi:hypothetical protein
VPIESMEADIRTVWNREVARTSASIIRVDDTAKGFEFRFALLHERGEFITGVIAVDYMA